MMKSTTTNTNKRKLSSKCDTCDTMFSNDQDLNSHLLTKDHLEASTQATELRRPFRLSNLSSAVVVTGFSVKTSLFDLENVFKSYGTVKQLILSRSAANSEPSCLLEFVTSAGVDAILKKMPVFGGKTLSVTKYSIKSSVVCREPSPNNETANKKVCVDAGSAKQSSSNVSSPSKSINPTSQRNGTSKDSSSSSNSSSKSGPASPADKLLKGLEPQLGMDTRSNSARKQLEKEKNPLNDTKKLAAQAPEKVCVDKNTVETKKVAAPMAKSITVINSRGTVLEIRNQKSKEQSAPAVSSRGVNEGVPSSSQVSRVKIDEKLYDEQIVGFVNGLQNSLPALQSSYMECFHAVEYAMGLLGVDYTCYLFGSSFTGLCWEGSDLDIYVHWEREVTNPEMVLNECRRALFRSGRFEKVIVIKARTPLIKCRHKRLGLDCDISFKSRLGVYNSVLIKILLVFDPRVKPMIVFLKYWGRKNELIGSNKINSYCLSWMIIFFLQTQNVLPTIEYLNYSSPAPASYFGWDVSFFNLSSSAIEQPRQQFLQQNPYREKSIRQLLIEFFDFYLTFDYAKNVICPLIGTTIPRVDLEKMTNLPPIMHQFVRIQRVSNPEDFMFDRAKTLCLQDPVELTFNVGKCMSPKLKDHFKLCCKTATHILITEKVNSFVPKLFSQVESASNQGESNAPSVTGQEEPAMTEEQLLRSLKKSLCHTIGVSPGQGPERRVYGTPFDKQKWISDLFFAFIFLLDRVFKFEVSIRDKNSCPDSILNRRYLQFEDKLDLDNCKIVYCRGFSVLFYNRKKYKSLPIPKLYNSKSEIEKEVYRNREILDKELKLRNEEEREKEKFNFIFCFNPVANKEKVDFTFMRYYKPNSIPGSVNYQYFFNFAQANFNGLISRALHFVQSNRNKIDLSADLRKSCENYGKDLISPPGVDIEISSPDHAESSSRAHTESSSGAHTESSSRAHTESSSHINQVTSPKKASDGSRKVAENSTEPVVVDIDTDTENVVINVKTEEELPTKPSKELTDSDQTLYDSDIEILPVEPKVFECIDVE